MSIEEAVHSQQAPLKIEPRLPPHSIEAEQSVIGGTLVDPSAWDRVADRISVEDFYHPEHQAIFRAIQSLAERHQPFDCLTVSEELKITNQKVDIAYIFQLANNTPGTTNIKAYAKIVRDYSILRQLVGISNEIASLALNTEGREVSEILDESEQKIFKIAEQKSRGQEPVSISHILVKANQRLEELQQLAGTISGASTGFLDLDTMTSGLQAGDLVVVAGRPSMGKTAFAMNIAENIACVKKPVLIFSMEMSSEQLAIRMLSSHGRIDQQKLRMGKLSSDDWARVNSAVLTLSQVPLFIDDTPALTPTEMRSRARRVSRLNKGLGLIVVDYLQLMRTNTTKENRTTEISEISRFLKTLAKELSVPVIALSQLNRSLEQRQDRRPIMSDLRESGAIEQDADLIAFIYRDEVYNEESPDKGIAEIIIGKQRNGPIGKVKLTFRNQFTRFENFAARDIIEARVG